LRAIKSLFKIEVVIMKTPGSDEGVKDPAVAAM
jgi:hypothetical protein